MAKHQSHADRSIAFMERGNRAANDSGETTVEEYELWKASLTSD